MCPSFCSIHGYFGSSLASKITLRSYIIYISGRNNHIYHDILISGLAKTPQYVQFSLIHQQITKVVHQHIVVSMLTMHIIPVSPQLTIVLLLKLNLVKEAGYSSVHGQGGKIIRILRDHIQKDVRSTLSVLDSTPQKKISKTLSPF